MSVSEDDLRDLLELETTLQALTETHGWQTLKERAEQRISEQKHRLLSGELSNHEDYLKVTWQIRGAEYVLGLPEETSVLVLEYRRLLAEQTSEDE